MKFELAAIALTALFAAADACKCRDHFQQDDIYATTYCCGGLANMKRDDCPPRHLGNNKAAFQDCCVKYFKTNSDCWCKECKPYKWCSDAECGPALPHRGGWEGPSV
ncbi:hypothetical protein ESCO_006603 [Escovopsis weberi]|uniref:Uncharacterized protein n=1 Tax=Escovopsis weberi TaxID=150374 RepID=A0A0M8NAJ3_ESCWE|nr:hypothetical protein ESCO_006603 [Escovopsis weberi]